MAYKNIDKTRKFNNLVCETFKNSKTVFDDGISDNKVTHIFIKIRKVMIADNEDFNLLSVQKQFEFISTIYKISLYSKIGVINQIKNIPRKDENIEKYDPEYGFEEPEYIELNGQKIICI